MSVMELGALLFRQSALYIQRIQITSQGITLVAASTADYGVCPACGQRSTRVHSGYCRRLQDLPLHGRCLWIELHLRRFFCDFPDCSRQTFAEVLPQIAYSHARKTCYLIAALQEVAFTAGGQAGARLADRLGMPTSGDTLLRIIRRTPIPSCEHAPRVLGVDDWALCRGQVYGTILCDLEGHRPVDLLPERSSGLFAAWLGEHPGAQIISRDRGAEYAKGATEGAPQALQTADPWHLLHNLTEALQRAVDGRQKLLAEAFEEAASTLAPNLVAAPVPQAAASPPGPPHLSRDQQRQQQSRDRRQARYQQVRELVGQGVTLREISRRLNMSREAVGRFARCDQFPERATPTPHPTLIDPYLPFLQQRWEEGCDNVKHMWQEIQAKGFTGSVYGVRTLVRRWRRSSGRRPARGSPPMDSSSRVIRPSARRIAWLALGHVPHPTDLDEATLKAIYQRWPELRETAELAKQFAGLFKEHDADSLDAWVQLAEEPSILAEIRRFAEGLRQDWAAVLAAVRGPWSQGQVEGQINRLKLIKRGMYGRANFDLLRQRVLHGEPASARSA